MGAAPSSAPVCALGHLPPEGEGLRGTGDGRPSSGPAGAPSAQGHSSADQIEDLEPHVPQGEGRARRLFPRGKAKQRAFSKRLVADIRALLWVVTLGGLFLAAWCIHKGYTGSLPWLSAMVGLPWTAHGAVCSFYLNMAKSDHKQGGITFEAAKAAGFSAAGSENSPPI